MRITTESRLSGSGPKKDPKIPGVEDTAGSLICPRPSKAAINPPLLLSTAMIIAAIPASMIIP